MLIIKEKSSFILFVKTQISFELFGLIENNHEQISRLLNVSN